MQSFRDELLKEIRNKGKERETRTTSICGYSPNQTSYQELSNKCSLAPLIKRIEADRQAYLRNRHQQLFEKVLEELLSKVVRIPPYVSMIDPSTRTTWKCLPGRRPDTPINVVHANNISKQHSTKPVEKGISSNKLSHTAQPVIQLPPFVHNPNADQLTKTAQWQKIAADRVAILSNMHQELKHSTKVCTPVVPVSNLIRAQPLPPRVTGFTKRTISIPPPPAPPVPAGPPCRVLSSSCQLRSTIPPPLPVANSGTPLPCATSSGTTSTNANSFQSLKRFPSLQSVLDCISRDEPKSGPLDLIINDILQSYHAKQVQCHIREIEQLTRTIQLKHELALEIARLQKMPQVLKTRFLNENVSLLHQTSNEITLTIRFRNDQ